MISAPYPNPVVGEEVVRVNLSSTCPIQVAWRVVSVANRKLAGGSLQVSGLTPWSWDLRDQAGKRASNGLYYLVFMPEGQPQQIQKVLILR